MQRQRQYSNQSNITGNLAPSYQVSIDKNLLLIWESTQTRIQSQLPIKQSLQANCTKMQKLQRNKECSQVKPNEPQNNRVKQFLFSFLISLAIPMTLTTLTTSMLIQLKDQYVQEKSWTCVGLSIFMFTYFIGQGLIRFGLIKVLKYYFCPDRLLPGMIISTFAYLAMTQQTANKYLYNKVAQVTYTFWFFGMAGNLRLSLKQYEWSRWHIFLTKLAYLYSGTTIFYAGTCYIYRGVHAKFPAVVRDHIKDLVLLFIFATVEALYQHYKFISKFDGTQKLMPPIDFQQAQRQQNIRQKTSQQLVRLMTRIGKQDIQRSILQ